VSVRWVGATLAGFVFGGLVLHSPGASGIGTMYLDADISAAAFGAILGAIVGAMTGVLQLAAMRRRDSRIVIASIIAVATAHALADGAPAIWGVAVVATLSGIVAALAFAWATRSSDPRMLVAWAVSWAAGWLVGVGIAGAVGLSWSASADVWVVEHAVISSVLAITWGTATSPAMRRILRSERALSSAG
jgi:hypothetical protein